MTDQMNRDENGSVPIAIANPITCAEEARCDCRQETSDARLLNEPAVLEVSVMAVECREEEEFHDVIDEGTIVAENVVETTEIMMKNLLKTIEQLQKDETKLLLQLRTSLESPEILQSTRGELLVNLLDKTEQLQRFQEEQRKILIDACDQRYRYNHILKLQGELRIRQNETKYHRDTILWLQGKAKHRPRKRPLRALHMNIPARPNAPTTQQKIASYCKCAFWIVVILMLLCAAINAVITVAYEVYNRDDDATAKKIDDQGASENR